MDGQLLWSKELTIKCKSSEQEYFSFTPKQSIACFKQEKNVNYIEETSKSLTSKSLTFSIDLINLLEVFQVSQPGRNEWY